jgi:hypothetical protein
MSLRAQSPDLQALFGWAFGQWLDHKLWTWRGDRCRIQAPGVPNSSKGPSKKEHAAISDLFHFLLIEQI